MLSSEHARPAQSSLLEVSFGVSSAYHSAYDRTIVVSSNDLIDPEVQVAAHLDVTGAPDIHVDPVSFDFGDVFLGAAPELTLTVSNFGTDALTISSFRVDHPDFSLSHPSLVLASGEIQDVTVTYAPSGLGPVQGTITLDSDDPDDPVVTIPVSGAGTEPPDIAVLPTSFDVSVPVGDSTSRVITLQNEGLTELLFQASYTPASSALGDAGPQTDEVVLQDDFEDGDFAGWLAAGVGGRREMTSDTAAHGSQYSYHESFSGEGHLDGIYQTFSPVQLQYISFWVRAGSTTTNDAYVVLRDAGGKVMVQFYARDNGRFSLNEGAGGSGSFAYSAETWYHIELREIDFTAKTMNFYVDSQLVQIGVPFRNEAVQKVSRVDLYNYTQASQAWWDEIEISTEPFRWIIFQPSSGTIPAGDSADVTATFDAHALAPGAYDATILVESNDPDEPEVSVPAHLEVLTAGCEKGDVIADGEVNSADAIRGLLIAIDMVDPTPQELCAADMNLDGSIEVGDVVLILQKAVGTAGALDTGPALSTGPALGKSPAQLFARAGDEIGTVQLRVGFARDTAYDGDLVLKFEVSDTSSPLRFVDVVAYDGSGVKQPVELSNDEFFFGVTGVDAPSLGKTRLLAAVPNPFNPRTRLRFVLSSPGDARLTIFNVAGRRVRELSLRQLSAGEHFVPWDGRDDAGARVASGSYLVHLEAKGTTDTRSVLLMK